MANNSPFFDLTADEQREFLTACGAPKYVYDILMKWIFGKMVFEVSEMTDLPKAGRVELKEKLRICDAEMVTVQLSKDGTQKALVRYPDGQMVECVAIPANRRLTFCISTMAGCPVQCSFCASGKNGLWRNLTCAEMLDQYFLLSRQMGVYPTNIVLMGSGEPLLNYGHVQKFLGLLNDPDAVNMGARKITVSTIGVPEGIERLAREGKQFELAFSLHTPWQKQREQLIPFAVKAPIPRVMEALNTYAEGSGRLVTFEYCLLQGVNDSVEDAKEVARLAKQVRAKVNLIPFNDHEQRFSVPHEDSVERFQDVLERSGVSATVRLRRGADIDAACGQLVAKQEAEKCG
jgi:23S rRNA (adenine2503-C2)-methyltransferase